MMLLFCLLLGLVKATTDLPIVDLGYTLHQASLNEAGKYYNFTNIRYAEPPIGNLRFAKPMPPQGRSRTVDDGSVVRQCPQAEPTLTSASEAYIYNYAKTGSTSLDSISARAAAPAAPAAPAGSSDSNSSSGYTEDCLFLDVMVPQTIFDRRTNNSSSNHTGAAVMVWIHGGTYISGDKSGQHPATLLSRTQDQGKEGVIYVGLNYRLGAFGFLTGPTFAIDGTPNAGFWDQRLALEWIQNNIHLFGGDPNRVTVSGESAGAGSIIAQMTAFGGNKGKAPFQQAIMESPAWILRTGKYAQEQKFHEYLGLLNVSTLAEARQLPSSAVIAANAYQISTSPNGTFSFGPSADGDFVPDEISLLLLHGKYDHDVKVLVGHNGDEGLQYPFLTNETIFASWMKENFPAAEQSVLDHIDKVLYPLTYNVNGTLVQDYKPNSTKSISITGYNDYVGRQTMAISDCAIACYSYYVNNAFNGSSYAFQFTVPPAYHSQELDYVFWDGDALEEKLLPYNMTLVNIMQDYWTNFVLYGNPNGDGLPFFPKYGNNSTVIDLSWADVVPKVDPADNERCKWWQMGYYT
ncbi:alpha/beta-hydrolase [Saccharata proteae CBS 121410]|uniref:Carboxylic ester hydrolase n=1 Tax=Saccharata proteae CBS 121410 TaxID=1314787 RepID=A0A6A5YCU5_9PEZI|nr:alpha/beta-hydrolase [Saccharata proteae CBS 121410]